MWSDHIWDFTVCRTGNSESFSKFKCTVKINRRADSVCSSMVSMVSKNFFPVYLHLPNDFLSLFSRCRHNSRVTSENPGALKLLPSLFQAASLPCEASLHLGKAEPEFSVSSTGWRSGPWMVRSMPTLLLGTVLSNVRLWVCADIILRKMRSHRSY